MSDTTFTHKDLARQLKVSETTIKSYRRKFPGCIPVSSKGKPIRFTSKAYAVCKRIRDLFEKGMSIEEVNLRLCEEFSWIEPSSPVASESGAEQESLHFAPGSGELCPPKGMANNSVLTPGFATAVSGLAKSVVVLTQQQGVLLDRLCSLEKSLQNPQLYRQSSEQTMPDSELASVHESNSCPEWAGDLASRLQGVEQALVRTLENLESSVNTFQLSDDPVDHLIPPVHSPPDLEPVQPVQLDDGGKARVLPWSNQQETKTQTDATKISEEYLRQISALALVVQVEGGYTGIAGRGPFCLNDVKAILAQSFSPPNHFVGRWETASGEIWYMLEQPEEEDTDSISLHLRPVETLRNQLVLEVARLMIGGVNEHPSSLYTLTQQLLG